MRRLSCALAALLVAGCSSSGADTLPADGTAAQDDGGAATGGGAGGDGGPGGGAAADVSATGDAGALPPRPLVVASTEDLGAISRPAHVVGRDGGPSCAVGGKILWTFGDTLLNPAASNGETFRTNTAALATPASPTSVTEPLDPSGAPYQFVPFDAAEASYNASTGNKGDDRYAQWTNTLLPDGNGGCLVFFSVVKIGSGQLKYTNGGAGIARVTGAKTTATRDPNLLFSPSEPSLTAAMADGGFVYVYLSLAQNKGIIVGRAPFAQAGTRSAYTFFDGASWQPDVTHGKPVGIAFLSSLSVTYNAYLRQYLAVGSAIFSADVMMLTAPTPAGPWTSVKGFTGMAPAANTYDYAAIEHPELDESGGQVVRITYYHPSGALTGELRLAEVRLQ